VEEEIELEIKGLGTEEEFLGYDIEARWQEIF
jgi:hypothetical protein